MNINEINEQQQLMNSQSMCCSVLFLSLEIAKVNVGNDHFIFTSKTIPYV